MANIVDIIFSSIQVSLIIVTFLFMISTYKRQIDRQKAERIKESIKTIMMETSLINNILKEGSILISASRNIGKELRSYMNEDFNKEKIEEILSKSKPMICIEGWNNTFLSRELQKKIDLARREALTLHGSLEILEYCVIALSRIVGDSYSPMIFLKLLEPELLEEVYEDSKKISNSNDFIFIFTNYLFGNSTKYFLNGYYDTVNALNEFIEKFAV
ncbi:unnamed protein product, partial [marine sediment metagenome]